jgi:hypothetical protein
MFIWCNYINGGFNYKNPQQKYRIGDSEFETDEIGIGIGGGGWSDAVAGLYAIISAYEKRNLPIAANIVRAIIYFNKKFNYSIPMIIKWNKQLNPKFIQYEKDIEKYLLLI